MFLCLFVLSSLYAQPFWLFFYIFAKLSMPGMAHHNARFEMLLSAASLRPPTKGDLKPLPGLDEFMLLQATRNLLGATGSY